MVPAARSYLARIVTLLAVGHQMPSITACMFLELFSSTISRGGSSCVKHDELSVLPTSKVILEKIKINFPWKLKTKRKALLDWNWIESAVAIIPEGRAGAVLNNIWSPYQCILFVSSSSVPGTTWAHLDCRCWRTCTQSSRLCNTTWNKYTCKHQ